MNCTGTFRFEALGADVTEKISAFIQVDRVCVDVQGTFGLEPGIRMENIWDSLIKDLNFTFSHNSNTGMFSFSVPRASGFYCVSLKNGNIRRI